MLDLPFDASRLLHNAWQSVEVPGGLCTRRGPLDYVGCVTAISGTLFFKDAHTPAVREAISDCFDEYVFRASPEFTWLFREDPPEGSTGQAPFEGSAQLTKMLEALEPNNPVSFHYTSGKKERDAGPWEFHVIGQPAWRAATGRWGLCGLRFSVPLSFVNQYPDAFRDLFVRCAQHLRATHGYAGHSLVLSPLRYEENQTFETVVASKFRGFDAGGLVAGAASAHLGIKSVGWLTAINSSYLEKLRVDLSEVLPEQWFGIHDYDAGVVIQAGPWPEAAPVDEPLPARLVLPDMLLQPLRTPQPRLHYASADPSELRLIGPAATQWIARLDVPVEQLAEYRARLLDEPKLPEPPPPPIKLGF